MNEIKVCGISGSLRARSFNTALLRSSEALMPEGMTLKIADISQIPLYNNDVEREQGFPEAVRQLKASVAGADAVLIATPEYNYSIPGVLKNALDWLTRRDDDGFQPLNMKPVGVMGASTGAFGTYRAQTHLRQVLRYANAYAVNTPEVCVMNAKQAFNDDLKLVDEDSREFLAEMLASLAELTHMIQQHERAQA